jgi:hypothetical protein
MKKNRKKSHKKNRDESRTSDK